MQPQVNYGSDARITANPDEQPLSLRSSGGFLDGFGPPSEPSNRPQEPATAINVTKASAALQVGDSSQVSGANRDKDADSGYASMPKNNGDTDHVLSANRLAAQPGTYWTEVPHEVGQYDLSGNDAVSASSGRVMSDDSFASIHDDAGHGSVRAYEDASHVFYGAASSSTDDGSVLLGLTLPEEPVNIWAYTNLDAEFSEYP